MAPEFRYLLLLIYGHLGIRTQQQDEEASQNRCPALPCLSVACFTEASIAAVQAEMAFRPSDTGIFGANADCQSGHITRRQTLNQAGDRPEFKSLYSQRDGVYADRLLLLASEVLQSC